MTSPDAPRADKPRFNRKLLWSAVALIAAACAFAAAYILLSPKPVQGAKAIAIAVTTAAGETTRFDLRTDCATLRGALEEARLIEGDESEYGLFVRKVNGVVADANKQEWWCFTKGGETMTTGVDATHIADGDSYEIVCKTGYDQY